MEKDSYSSTTTKSSFIRRSASFGNTSPFSSRGNKHIFRAYPSTLKIAELCFETTAAHSTIIWSDWLGFLPLWGTGTVYCHFHSFIDLPENTTLYTETMLKTALELLEINYVQLSTQDLKPSANNNKHCSLAKTITRCIKFTKKVELWIHFLKLDDIFEPLVRMNSLYGKRWVKCFLLPHTTSHRKQTAHEYKYSQTRLI